MAGATASWSEEFTPAAKVTLAPPRKTRATSSSVRLGAAAAPSSARPKASAEPLTSAAPVRPRAPATSAASTEPTPIAVVSAA